MSLLITQPKMENSKNRVCNIVFSCVSLVLQYASNTEVCVCRYWYSGSSLSGRSQQRPPSLMWSQISGNTTMNAFTSESLSQKPPL